ncbi:MFS transporter [Kutzneria sp. CA-103260]|uniref:MFS transporter n=1 Tax=Kutzneria sp. CA-103260 TaxID=2802641 RepID=UPI001BA690EB|nr:MFS transporter [Kutzneria sp. CA-103260]QUQ65429.1 MFS transporter [Kutzneria sp. CA-103260]
MTSGIVKAGPREWVALVVLMLPVLVIAATATVLSFALPFVSASLAPTSVELLWIVDVYAFVLSGLLLVMGNLGDRIGRRRLLLIGTAVLAVFSVAAAVTGTAWVLLLIRAVHGAAAAAVMPSTLSLIRTIFRDGQQRRFAIAVWAGTFAAGGALGPIAGGLLLQHFGWGSVFLVNVPLLLPALLFGWRLLPEYRDPRPGPFDLLSVTLSLAAVLPVIYGIKSIAAEGPGLFDVVLIAAGLGVGVLFARRQRRLAQPMLDLGLFRNISFSTALLSTTMAVFALVGMFFFVGQYLQSVLGMGPLEAGLWTVPAAVLAGVGATGAAALAKWVKPGVVISVGMMLAAAGFVLLAVTDRVNGLVLLVAGLSLVGLGIGIVQSLATDMAVANAPIERAGAASAVLESATEFGGAIGITVLGSVGAATYHRELARLAPADLPATALHAASQTVGDAVAIARGLGGEAGRELLAAARMAFGEGMHAAAVVGAILMIAAALLCAVVLSRDTVRRTE